jgi:hypothetical protein
MRDYTPILDRRRKLRQQRDRETDTLLDQANAHPELFKYVTRLTDAELKSLERQLGSFDAGFKKEAQDALFLLFFDGYNTRRAINDAEIAGQSKDPFAMSALEEMVKDVPSYDPVLKRNLDLTVLVPMVRSLRREHPELEQYARDGAEEKYAPLLSELGIDADEPKDKPQLGALSATFAASLFAGYIIRYHIEQMIYAKPQKP